MSLQLFLLFCFAVTAGFSDIATGKVRNKDILIFLGLGILYFAVVLARGIVTHNQEVFVELKLVGINFFLAFAVSFIMRSFGVWPAGDAKAYALINIFIPLSCYKHIYFGYFPGFTLLINIFVAGILYVLLKTPLFFLTRSRPSIKKQGASAAIRQAVKHYFSNWTSHLRAFSSYLVVFFTMGVVSTLIHQEASPLIKIAPEVFIVILFFILRPVGGFINKRMSGVNHAEFYLVYYVLMLFVNGWSLQKTNIMILLMIINAVKFLLFYGIIMGIADYYINKAQTKTKPLHELKTGDLPTRQFMQMLSPEALAELKVIPEGLSEQNIKVIVSDLSKKTDAPAEITVYVPIPFVPIIIAGVLFTVITGVSSAQYIKLFLFR